VDRLTEILDHLKMLKDEVEFLSIPQGFKDGMLCKIESIEKMLATGDIPDSPNRPSGISALPEIHLVEIALIPMDKAVNFNGKSLRLPPYEFNILYQLASNAGTPVQFEISHSFHSRMSKLRRDIPVLRKIIERVGGGYYVLNSRGRKPAPTT
jgi:DNA-binding response OmpR family regulator